MTDDLATRFPPGRHVVLFPEGRRGVVAASTPTFVRVTFDDDTVGRYDADWFRRFPTALRLAPLEAAP